MHGTGRVLNYAGRGLPGIACRVVLWIAGRAIPGTGYALGGVVLALAGLLAGAEGAAGSSSSSG
jgi:hypothetical protein